ncbi:MAG: hypothetical protein H0X30_21305 [Anaerolineae bacterium]|nr:hypothetical protein [Anaerolineae bacterium]
MVVSNQLIRFSTRFQRAVHLRYDLRNPEAIDRYIPTVSGVQALESILKGTEVQATQRAHVLYAAYGSGKSLIAVCIASILENRNDLLLNNEALLSRIGDTDTTIADLAEKYLHSHKRLMPVVLSGNEGEFATALIRALSRALNEAGLGDVQPTTRFDAALKTLNQWHGDYPHALHAFEQLLLKDYNSTLDSLDNALKAQDEEAFKVFEAIYPQVTAGAIFDRFSEVSPELVYRDVALALVEYGYTGIVVIWDEFGRYLEGRTTDIFRGEAASLQNFAETCNYSGEQQIHLMLFTHKELQSYTANLPKAYQQEWSRIEGRFQRHNVTSDPYVAYRLIANSLEHTDTALVYELFPQVEADRLVNETINYQLFNLFASEDISEFIYATYPLHPLTVYALVRLSNRVAQNERTMFTFLVADEPKSLQGLLREIELDFGEKLIRPDTLWDYFEGAIRADVGVNGTHRIWAGVTNALDKIPSGIDNKELAIRIVKTLGVLLICVDQGAIRPSTGLLEWVIGHEGVEDILKGLSRRKAIINRKIDGYWTFTNGSDVDFEQKLAEMLERTNPTPVQLRRLLDQLTPAPTTLARRYNQERAITRYFTGIYRWVYEVEDTPWDLLISQTGNSDGLVVYLLTDDSVSHESIRNSIEAHPRVLYVFSEKPLTHITELLRELFALQELENDPTLRQHEDSQRVRREISWLIEDAQLRLEREIGALIDPLLGKSVWIKFKNETVEGYQVSNASYPTRLVSQVCDAVYSDTPVFNSEGLNKHYPTTQQLKASQKVINAMFNHELSGTLGLEGYGPEVLNLNTLLIAPSILRQHDGQWIIALPPDERLAIVWQIIDDYLLNTCLEGARTIEPLVQILTEKPYGLRLGILPLLFSAVLYRHLRVTTIRKDGRVQMPITGELVSEIFTSPTNYTIEVGEWNDRLEVLWRAILSRFSSHIHQSEYYHQPLTLLPNVMIRWLQSQSQFCRQTRKLSADVLRFRDLIRVAQTEPAKVLFYELPDLLNIQVDATQSQIEELLDSLLTAISNAYLDLQRRLDRFTQKEFGQREKDGFSAMKTWLNQMQGSDSIRITDFRFGTLISQKFVATLLEADDADGQFWDKLSNAVTGIHLRDWTDQSETRFYDVIVNARQDVEREVKQLVAEESVIALSLQLPDNTEREFRFRSTDLSAQGKRLLQNFMSTLEIAGRPLSADEKRQIAVAFLLHVMGEEIVGNR